MYNQYSQHLPGFIFGVLVSMFFLCVLGALPAENNNDDFLINGEFGDLVAYRFDFKHEETGTDEALMLCKGKRPLMQIYKNAKGEIHKFALIDVNSEGIIATAKINNNKLSTLTIFGNKNSQKEETPILSLNATQAKLRSENWAYSIYMHTDNNINAEGSLESYSLLGEVYYDLDVDGQFDAKCLYDDKSKVVSKSLFDNESKTWKVIASVDNNGYIIKQGTFDPKDDLAWTLTNNVRESYRFVSGKGWEKVDR